MRPPRAQSAVIQLVRNGTPFEEPFTSIVEIAGSGTETLRLIPGAYHATIVSFLKQDLVIPSDKRCIKIPKFELGFIPAGHEEKCYTIPEQPIVFNSTTPFPNGGAEFDLVIAPSQLRGTTYIEFRQFSMGIENVAENQRTVEDIAEIGKVDLYSTAERDRLTPVIT